MSKTKIDTELDEELDLNEQNEEMLEEGAREMELEDEDEAEDNEEESAVGATQKGRGRRLMTALLNNEGENNITNVKDLFKSIELNGEWFKHNISFIITVTACLLIFVTNRYQAQQEQIEEARLKKELAEMRYKWLTRFSELTKSTRQSHIEELLKQKGDPELKHSKEAPFIIRASK